MHLVRLRWKAWAPCWLALGLIGCGRFQPPPASMAAETPLIRAEQARALIYTTATVERVAPTHTGSPLETARALAPAPTTTYTLEQLHALAREANPSFAVFAANRAAARAELLRASAYPNPQLELGLGVARSREAPNETGLEYGFGLSQALEWPAKRRARRAAAEAEAPLAELEAAGYRAQLRADVARAYATVLYHQRAARLAREAWHTERQIRELVSGRVEGGEAPPLDLVKARVETLRAQRAVQEQARLLEAARAVLNALAGRTLSPGFGLQDTLEHATQAVDAAEAERLALAQHPELRRLAAVVHQRELAVRREQTAWYPDLTLGLGPQRALDTDSLGATLGFALPLWDRNAGGIAAAQAELARARAELEQARQAVLLELETGTQRYAGACEQLAAFDGGPQGGLRGGAAEALRLAMFLYREGEADLLQLLDALRTSQATQAEYLQALVDVQLTRADLERAIGIGGEE